jgi:hypothetical protein
MDWPSIENYRTALQRPEQVFRDTRLKSCAPERNKMGLPRGRAGRYAIVYRMSNGSWSTAVRVFLRQPKADRQKRYSMVHGYLQQVRPRCLVDFGYDAEGILLGGQWFPIQTLEWVDGVQLGEWVKEAVVRGDSRTIKQMADAWIELVTELRRHRIAHGDLQHGNVMVVQNRLVLVDYDCMYVPTMKSEADREAWEFGMPGYQHPDRVGKLIGPDLDNFSAWAILISLRAVADDPDLWNRYVGETGVENLLFTRDDVESPARSRLWPDLIQNAKDRRVREWAANLRASLEGPFEQVPPFDIDIFDPLRAVIAGGDWGRIHELAVSVEYESKMLPPDLADAVQEASGRTECLSQLEAKVRSGKLQEIAAAYRPELLEGWADPTLLAKAKAAASAVELLGKLARAEQFDPSGRLLVSLWQRSGVELEGLVEGDRYRDKVAAFQSRFAAAERLSQAVEGNGPEKAIVAAWRAVIEAGGQQDAEPFRGRAELAVKRHDALTRLESLSRKEDKGADQAIIKFWETVAEVLDGCAEADVYRDRADAARSRTTRLQELLQRIEAVELGRCSEREVLAAAAELPPGYAIGLSDRINLARERLAAAKALDLAVREAPQSDLAIAAAAQRVRASGEWPSNPDVAARCDLALRRQRALRTLDAIPTTLLLDEQDARWIAGWDEALLTDCHVARDHRARYELAVARTAAATALKTALSAGDAVTLERLRRDPRLSGHPELLRHKVEIDELIATDERVERLLEMVRRGSASEFLAEAESALIAANASVFLPHRARIEGWIDNLLKDKGVLRPAEPPFVGTRSTGAIVVRWSWGLQRLVRACIVATDPKRFFARPEDAKGQTENLDPKNHLLVNGGALVLAPQGCRQLFVTVWPVVDLGWTRRIGPPLCVGPNLDGSPRNANTSDAPAPGRPSLRQRLEQWRVSTLDERGSELHPRPDQEQEARAPTPGDPVPSLDRNPDFDNHVRFTIYRANRSRPEVWNTMLAFAYRAGDADEGGGDITESAKNVEKLAADTLGPHIQQFAALTTESREAVPRATTLRFVPRFNGVEFNPPERSFRWVEKIHQESFRYRVPAILDGQTIRGRMEVYLDMILIGEVGLALAVDSAVTPDMHTDLAAAHGRLYRKVFASYSHKDLSIVEQFEAYIKALGDEFVRDWTHLRSGQVWSEQLESMISEADVFQLFWSTNSMDSDFVRQEWEYALGLSRPSFVRPVYWEEPMPERTDRGLPPESLRKIHFAKINRSTEHAVRERDSCSTRDLAMSVAEASSDSSSEDSALLAFLEDLKKAANPESVIRNYLARSPEFANEFRKFDYEFAQESLAVERPVDEPKPPKHLTLPRARNKAPILLFLGLIFAFSTVVSALAKQAGFITWSWWAITVPLWASFAIWLLPVVLAQLPKNSFCSVAAGAEIVEPRS